MTSINKKRLRISILHYKINNIIKREAYIFGRILNINDIYVIAYIENLALEALNELLSNKHMIKEDKTSKLLSFEAKCKISKSKFIELDQDFKMNKFKLKDLQNFDELKLKNLKNYSLNSVNKRLIRFILGKPYELNINENVMINDCDSDDEELRNTAKIDNFKTNLIEKENHIIDKHVDKIVEKNMQEHFRMINEVGKSLKVNTKTTAPVVRLSNNNDSQIILNNEPIRENNHIIEPMTKWINSFEDLKEFDNDIIRNTLMLIEINYLKYGGFYINKNRAILKTPCGHAFGDFLSNRFLCYRSEKNDTFKYCISRLNQVDVLNYNLKFIF